MVRKGFMVVKSQDADYTHQLNVFEGGELVAVMPLYSEEFERLRDAVLSVETGKAERASLAYRVKVAAHTSAGLSCIADGLNDSVQGTDVIWFVTDKGILDYYFKVDAPEHSEVSLDELT